MTDGLVIKKSYDGLHLAAFLPNFQNFLPASSGVMRIYL